MTKRTPALANRCLLCDEIEPDYGPSHATAPHFRDRQPRLAESKNFVLIPDISPVVPGHSLVVTKHHYTAFAQVLPDCRAELSHLKRFVSNTLERSHGVAPFFFEHGSRPGSTNSAACISHAHMHAIPAGIDIFEDLARYTGGPVHFADTRGQDLVEDVTTDYLYYEESTGRAWIMDNLLNHLPHQLIRRVVASAIGHPNNWNWRAQVPDEGYTP